MSYAVGDLVRIKAANELKLKGIKVQGGSAIDKWQNKICEITEIRKNILGRRYIISFLEKPVNKQDEFAAGVHISKYMWEEYELELLDTYVGAASIEEKAYEALLGGVQ